MSIETIAAPGAPFPACQIRRPAEDLIPVVYDSPHSGSVDPPDFRVAIDRMTLRRSEDAHLDELFAHVAERGAPLLHALFPRAYIDPNRDVTDLDLGMIEGDWLHPVDPTQKTLERGVGLIWRQMKALGPIYDRKLTVAEVDARIAHFWRPYHDALRALLDAAHARFGVVYHVDCHSMASWGDATTEDGAVERPDFVIGDREGASCSSAFRDLVVDTLRAEGCSVALNDPYKGFELVRRYSDPGQGRHSIQIEVSRARYMDEATLTKSAEYFEAQRILQRLTNAIAEFAMV